MSGRPHLIKAWLAGFTRRWHANPDLCHTFDPTAAHSGRMVVLAHLLFPDASKDLLVAAALHDLGESGVGDVAGPAKHGDPILAEAIARAEARKLEEMRVTLPVLSPHEAQQLEFCDRLDAWLWAMRHQPRLRFNKAWLASKAELRRASRLLGVAINLSELMSGVLE